MIDATFYRCDGSLAGFALDGHAGYARSGRDIVCAAVSALAQGALLGLEEVARIAVEVVVDEDDGRLECRLPRDLDKGERRDADVILETLLKSLRRIETGYAGAIRVQERPL